MSAEPFSLLEYDDPKPGVLHRNEAYHFVCLCEFGSDYELIRPPRLGRPRARGESGGRALEPAQIARRCAALQAPAHEADGVVVALERQVAHHHCLLVELPLGVAATCAVALGRQ